MRNPLIRYSIWKPEYSSVVFPRVQYMTASPSWISPPFSDGNSLFFASASGREEYTPNMPFSVLAITLPRLPETKIPCSFSGVAAHSSLNRVDLNVGYAASAKRHKLAGGDVAYSVTEPPSEGECLGNHKGHRADSRSAVAYPHPDTVFPVRTGGESA